MDSYIYLKDRAGNNLGTSDNPLVIYATGGATSTTVHNDLASLQGNGTDYFHLDATQYASVAAWNVGSGGSGDYAVTSGYATNSGYATSAGSATNASYANNAAYATVSGFATNATFAISSGTATNATYANISANATYAASSGSATNATYAVGSGTATNASYSALSAQASTLVNGATLSATVIYLDRIGTTTYHTLQDWVDILQSGGRIDGGVLTASATAGTLDVSQIDVFIKTATSEIASTKYYTVAATAALALTQNSINYIYVDYNNGVPIIKATTDRTTINYTTQFNLGRAFRELSDEVEVLFSGINLYNRTRRVHERWIDTFGGLSYANGITPSCTGLKPAITGGALYAGSNKITISATDCNAGATFDYYYTTDGGSTWTTTSTNTLDNLRYNDTATGLASLGASRYGVHWLYVCPDGDIYVLYGKGNYTLTQAQAAVVASPIPNYLSQWAKLAAKIIIASGATTVQQITTAWTTQFPVQYAGNHNDLGGLQGGTTSEYYHLNATSYASVAAWNVGGTPTYVAIAGYATVSGMATALSNTATYQAKITYASRFYPVVQGIIPTTSPATWNQDTNDFVYVQFASTAVTYWKIYIGLDDFNTTAFKVTPIFTNPSSAGNASFMFDSSWDGTTWGATVGSITTLSTTATKQEGTQSALMTPGGTKATTCMVRATRIATGDTIAALVNLIGTWVQWGVTRV